MFGLADWLATYAVHSTILLSVGLAATRWVPSPLAARRLLLVAIFAAPISTSLALATFLGETEPGTGAGSFRSDASAGSTGGSAQKGEVAARSDTLLVRPVPDDDLPSRRSRMPFEHRIHLPAPSWAMVLPVAWLLIALLGVGHFGITTMRSLRFARLSTKPFTRSLGPDLREYVDAEHPDVRLVMTEEFIAPQAIHPNIVVIPAWTACELSASELRVVFDHERAHLTQRDSLWRVVFVLLGRIFFSSRFISQLCAGLIRSPSGRPTGLQRAAPERGMTWHARSSLSPSVWKPAAPFLARRAWFGLPAFRYSRGFGASLANPCRRDPYRCAFVLSLWWR